MLNVLHVEEEYIEVLTRFKLPVGHIKHVEYYFWVIDRFGPDMNIPYFAFQYSNLSVPYNLKAVTLNATLALEQPFLRRGEVVSHITIPVDSFIRTSDEFVSSLDSDLLSGGGERKIVLDIDLAFFAPVKPDEAQWVFPKLEASLKKLSLKFGGDLLENGRLCYRSGERVADVFQVGKLKAMREAQEKKAAEGTVPAEN